MVRRINRIKGDFIFDTINYSLMVMATFLFIYPFWHIGVLSFSSPAAANQLGFKFFPSEFSVMPYKELFKSDIIYIGYLNTIYRTVFGTSLTVIVTFLGAYGLSKKNLPFRNAITLLILFTMFFSGGLIPSYWLIKSLGLLNNRWALILPVMTNAWYLIIARNFIMTLPVSFEEAALIDGARPLTIAFRIIFPLSKPVIAVLALWCAVAHWNAWFDALIYIRERGKMVLQLILRRILIEQNIGAEVGNILTEQTSTTTPESVKAATIIVSIGPIIILYPFLQRYFVKGIMIGALKG